MRKRQSGERRRLRRNRRIHQHVCLLIISVIVNQSRPKNLGVSSANNAAIDIKGATSVAESDLSICDEKKQPLCRHLAASGLQLTSHRFMLPEVCGLSPKSLNIQRNSVSASYSFR